MRKNDGWNHWRFTSLSFSFFIGYLVGQMLSWLAGSLKKTGAGGLCLFLQLATVLSFLDWSMCRGKCLLMLSWQGGCLGKLCRRHGSHLFHLCSLLGLHQCSVTCREEQERADAELARLLHEEELEQERELARLREEEDRWAGCCYCG